MKMCLRFYYLLLTGALVSVISSCSDKCEETYNYVYYEPVYSTSAAIRAAVKQEAPKPLSQIGRIYFKDGFLFINEVGEGIHIIDNRNPAAPQNISFLVIPGNYDLAIKGNTLYADSYVDLVAFDITTLSAIHEVNRIENLFNNYQTLGLMVASERGILTHWEKREGVTIQKSECATEYQTWGGFYYERGVAFLSSSSAGSKAAISPVPSATGIGGSMARFTIVENYLYGLDGANLDVVNIAQQTAPKSVKEFSLAWDIETIFPHNDKLFIGSQSGMYIVDVSEPESPVQVSRYSHIQSCDPVVVEGDYAYVTLRSGTACQGFTNQLEVINISNPESPILERTYPMTNPHGLGIDNGTLFICDGSDGLKIYNATNIHAINQNQVAHYANIKAFDIIPYQNIAMMIGEDGLYQYNYSNLQDIKLISALSITRPE
ncbi:MAG: hypothetical protein KF763_12170 [Cyclobacteriaceae bacterium]|nr:hypothetical protein [Cyclobacteriaceae bacterium]